MKHKKIELPGYNLHILKTDKFKKIICEINFIKPVEKIDLTFRNLLGRMLLSSSKKYPTKLDINIKQEELYNSNISYNNYRIGNFVVFSIRFTMLNEKYTEEGLFEDGIKFVREILFNPNKTKNKFKKPSFEISKKITEKDIKRDKDNKGYYARLRMLEEMDKTSPISYKNDGYLEDLNKINPKNLYEYYIDMLKCDKVDVFILGDVKEEKVEKIIKENIMITTLKPAIKKELIIKDHQITKQKIIKEKDYIKQAKLSIGCYIKNLTDYERNYVLLIYNFILGGHSNSKLHDSIREEHSLAYIVYSNKRSLDHLLFISAGIAYQNFERVVELVKKELKNMQQGIFKLSDINKAKTKYIDDFKTAEDYPGQILGCYYDIELGCGNDFKMDIKKIKEVTKEDIIKVAKKIKTNTIFLLHGDDKNEKI